MNIFQHLARAAAELLTLPDPFPEAYKHPQVIGAHKDSCGQTVLEVRAMNYRDVSRITEGTTPAGNVTEVHTRVGHNRWEIHQEDNQ